MDHEGEFSLSECLAAYDIPVEDVQAIILPAVLHRMRENLQGSHYKHIKYMLDAYKLRDDSRLAEYARIVNMMIPMQA